MRTPTGGQERLRCRPVACMSSKEVLRYSVNKLPQVGAEIPFFYLTPESIFSNQPADFLKQLVRSEKACHVGERFVLLECQN